VSVRSVETLVKATERKQCLIEFAAQFRCSFDRWWRRQRGGDKRGYVLACGRSRYGI